MTIFKSIICLICLCILISCSPKEKELVISVKNTLDMDRSFETVALNKEDLMVEDISIIGIKDMQTKELETTQTVDSDGDGIMDQLLFQPEITANSENRYAVVIIQPNQQLEVEDYCYSRFVPERTDDYAWENNKVAFRVFGPTAQKMKEEAIPGGTLSSGVDAWLKRVSHPIINNWYKKEIETEGTYHEDTGEGLDNFHVGISRGVGGLAIKKNNTYYFSKNYTKWKTITTGPIRTSFYLEYKDWDADGTAIKESKIISLDYGNNLSKFETTIIGSDIIAAGLTLHKKDGIVTTNMEKGWISYWQHHENSELGMAIVANPSSFSDYEKYDVEAKDLSNLYAHLKVSENKIIYYAGFGWKESGQFKNRKEWETYLGVFAKKIITPLEVEVQSAY
ncbi:MAG: DUF4861 family protein [Cellulophaga sp.]